MLKSTILVAVADIKGGVGKTTTAMLIAGCLARRGEHVTVLDADNTGGATLWDEYVRIEDDRRRKEDEANGTPHKPYKLGFDVIQTNDVILGMPDRIRERYKGWVIIDTLHPMRERCRRHSRRPTCQSSPASRPSAI